MSGGYESFEDKLTGQYKDNDRIRYHVSCITNGPWMEDKTRLNGVLIISNIIYLP